MFNELVTNEKRPRKAGKQVEIIYCRKRQESRFRIQS